MEIGVEDLPGTQHRALDRLRFLHLDDHLGGGEDFGGGGDDLRARLDVQIVARADALAGPGLHQHAVAAGGQLMHALGGQPDAIFVVLDLFDGADDHPDSPEKWGGALMRVHIATS